MPHGNYTVSTFSSSFTNVGDPLNFGVTVLKITPEVGYVVKKENFSISGDSPHNATPSINQPLVGMIFYKKNENGCVLPPEIEKVGFYDVDNPPDVNYDPNYVATTTNIVNVQVYLEPTFNTMPVTPTVLDIDIDGVAVLPSQLVKHCIREYYSSDICFNQWPQNLLADRNTNHCQSFFSNYITIPNYGTIVNPSFPIPDPQYSPNWTISTGNIINNWTLPSGSAQPTGAFAYTHNGDINQGMSVNIIKRTLWTGPGFKFKFQPSHELHLNASGYSVTQTPNQTVTATVTQNVIGTHQILLDTTEGIIPGMIVSGVNITSSAGINTYPYTGTDVRVIAYPHQNGIVISDEQQQLQNGDILTFQNYDDSGNTIATEFTTTYTPTSAVNCNMGHQIHYIAETEISDPIHGSAAAVPLPKISNVALGTKGKSLAGGGGLQIVKVVGSPNATYNMKITNNAGSTYNFETETFTSALTTSGSQVIGVGGVSSLRVVIPEVSANDEYAIVVTPESGSALGDSIPKTADTYKIKQFVGKTITFDTTGSGLTIASTLDATFSNTSNLDLYEARNNFSLSGAVTKSGPAILYTHRQPTWNTNDGGDFTNTKYLEKKVLSINGAAITLENVTNLSTGMYVFGDGVVDEITVSSITGNTVVLSTRQERIIMDQDLRFSVGGHHIVIGNATVVGSGTTELKVSVKGTINRFGSTDTTVTFGLANFISEDPTSPDIDGIECVDGEVLDISLIALDTDVNASDKTYSLVSGAGPSKGSLSGFGGSGSAFDDGRVRYTHDGSDEDIGTTDAFKYKATIGSDVGDADAEYGLVTISIIEA